jgi:hypothetical protein
LLQFRPYHDHQNIWTCYHGLLSPLMSRMFRNVCL